MGAQCSGLHQQTLMEVGRHDAPTISFGSTPRNIVPKLAGDVPGLDNQYEHKRHFQAEPEHCALCLEALGDKRLGVCTSGKIRVCSHYFHHSCLRRVNPRRCPQCRTDFDHCKNVPNIVDDVVAWARVVTVGGGDRPSKKEVMDAFKAMLPLPPNDVESLLTSFPGWTTAADPLPIDFLNALAATAAEHLPQSVASSSASSEDEGPVPPPPMPMHSTTSHRGGRRCSSVPGDACSCGRIHAMRGDRVIRGPAWCRSNEDGGAGELGTIVRADEDCDSVFVQWDRSNWGEISCYAWPADSTRHQVMHAAFSDVAPAIQSVQFQTGLSSAAATELVKRRTTTECTEHTPALMETELRNMPDIFHRCRVLPDRALVRRWFDACPPCSCTMPGCRGGVKWNAQAAQHLGREAYVLKYDERDGTVLLEMAGKCNCKIWYPRNAVEAVYDPDTVVQPRFQAGTAIECKVGGEWVKGVVSRVWWRPSSGLGNRPSVPYSIKLVDGRSVFAPQDHNDVVRAPSLGGRSPTPIR